jgi:protease secretion system outer membrane protein
MRALTLRPLAAPLLCAAMLFHAQPALSLGLLAAYDAALANDPVYRSAQRDNEAGQQYEVLGRANLLPTVSASYQRNRNQADITSPTVRGDFTEHRNYTGSAASIQFRQPIYHPEGQARYRQGIAQTSASNAQLTAQRQNLIVRLVGLYAPAKYAEDQLSQAIAQRDAYAEQRRSNERMLRSGEGTRTDVLETQAKYDLAEAQVLEAHDNLTNTRNALANMVGQDVDALDPLVDNFRVQPMLPETFETWKALALANNAEIAVQRLVVEIAQQEIKKNGAGHLPRLDLVASLGKNDSETTSTFGQHINIRSVGLQVSVPIYSGGAVTAATQQAVANYEKAQEDLEAKTDAVLLELRKQYNLTLSSAVRIDATVKALSSATLLIEATRKSVTGGQRTNLDVLNAQQQMFEARRDLALARFNYLLGYLRLRSAAGTLGPADLQTVATYFVSNP